MNFLLFEWHNLDTRWHNSLVCLEFISLWAHVCQLLSVCLFSSGCHITGRDSLPDPLWETSLLYPCSCNIWFNTNIFLGWSWMSSTSKAFKEKRGTICYIYFDVELILRNTWSSWICTRNVRSSSFTMYRYHLYWHVSSFTSLIHELSNFINALTIVCKFYIEQWNIYIKH